jgi:hypothetical protein
LPPRDEFLRLAVDEDVLEAGVIRDKAARHRPVVESVCCIGDDETRRLADGGEVTQFGRAVTG